MEEEVKQEWVTKHCNEERLSHKALCCVVLYCAASRCAVLCHAMPFCAQHQMHLVGTTDGSSSRIWK